jgi:phosphatidylserine/phosphatidylglycerophosphate/cardiolipin synthase-like enzyme
MQTLVQPEDGVGPLLSGIGGAKKSIEIAIFRFDEREIETALEMAVWRGVFVHALIAYTNSGGEKKLRETEERLLAAGVTVARTADDLARYHNKLMIVDRRELYLMAFNCTNLDIGHSRSFGLVTEDGRIVQEAIKLFEADAARQPYMPRQDDFVVSPANARERLSVFINGAQKQLLIYDGKLTDSQIIRLLQGRAEAGVEVRVIGQMAKRADGTAGRRRTRTWSSAKQTALRTAATCWKLTYGRRWKWSSPNRRCIWSASLTGRPAWR